MKTEKKYYTLTHFVCSKVFGYFRSFAFPNKFWNKSTNFCKPTVMQTGMAWAQLPKS